MHLAPYVIGGLAAVLVMDYAPSLGNQVSNTLKSSWSSLSSTASANQVVRSSKGDRAAPARPATVQPEIATVEVVGLRDAAIVYRDRDGRELFRTDPVSNVTIVTKGLMLPEVTVRQQATSTVKPMTPVQPVVRDVPEERTTPAPRRLKVPVGCEPSFSPVAQPSMAHHTGRCMASAEAPIKTA